MRPRQNLRDFHHQTPPPTSQPTTYQSVNHSVTLQNPLQSSMAPPPPLPMSAAQGPPTGQSSQPPILPQSDLFAELLRLGFNPEDMTKQSSSRPQVREEVLKNLQAILGKRDSADLLRKLLPMQNDWQNAPTPDYQRVVGGNSGANVGDRETTLSGPILSSTGGGTGGAISFSNNINGNSSQQQEQDVQYASAQQQQQHQAAAAAAAAASSAVNHHQHFRVPTTNTTMHNPTPLQQQQLLSQHKSVLSLHHQQHHLTHPHQNDSAHRQRLNQQHKLNSAPNSSIANINDMSGGPSSSSLSSSNATLLDTKNSSIFSHRTSPAMSSYTIPSAGTTPRVPNIMDALGGQPGLDNMHDTTPFQQTITMNNRDKLKSLAKHQQMQKQFRSTADKHKNLQWPSQSASSANLNLVTDSQNQQRIIGSNIGNNNTNNMGLTHLQRQITSPLSSAISPTQAPPGLPKSLLNLAACSTSPPSAGNVNSTNNRIASQLSNARNANVNQLGNNPNSTNNRQFVRNNMSNITQRATSSSDPNTILQQIMARSSNSKNQTTPNRGSYSNFSLSSLLSDDQTSNQKNSGNNNNNRSVINNNSVPNVRTNSQSNQPVQRRPSSARSEDTSALPVNASSRDAYLAYLQERAAKSGVSIGEINSTASNHIADQPSQLQNVLMAQQETNESNEESQGDIESALSRVEARNDLSLLYPPVSLANNSQKQINSLSAGIKLPEETDLFTDEIRKIVQEGCNIIYECKTCSNLFRSLANLVKHKRLYCKEDSNKAIQLELTRRSNIGNIQNVDMSVTKSSRDNVISRAVVHKDNDDSGSSLLADNRPRQAGATMSLGAQKYNLRGKRVDVSCLTGDSRSVRSARNQDRPKDIRGQNSTHTKNYPDNLSSSPGQTNLSRLLQSQPRNRPMKDSALMDALSMSPSLPVNNSRGMVGNSSINKLNEQLVRNSSLAKTLLSENVKSINENQSNIDTFDVGSLSNQKPPAAPKRKFLEDCIRKVKRDKLVPSESVGSDTLPARNQDSLETIPQEEPEHYRDPLDIDDSEADSDALIMDVEESYLPQSRRKGSSGRRSPHRSQTRSLENTSRLNSSSALLKALTRPVEPKPSYPSSQRVEHPRQSLPGSVESSKSTMSKIGSPNFPSADNKQQPETEKQATEQIVEKQQLEELAVQPLSPILDKYNCETCATEFPDHQTLFEHVINNHKSHKKIHPCIFCSLSFLTLENVCRHIIDIHKKTKTEVSRLKDVVESRSFYRSDFTACTDLPEGYKDESKNKADEGRKTLTPDALSDLAATEQILNDTVASVSMASSPTKTSVFSPSKKLPSLVSRSSSRLAAKQVSTSDYNSEGASLMLQKDKDNPDIETAEDLQDETDDLLSDSMIPSITDEHLAILERQEAEIEAERLRREAEAYGKSEEQSGDNLSQNENDDDSQTGKMRVDVDEPGVDSRSVDGHKSLDSNQWSIRQNEFDEKDTADEELSNKSDIDTSEAIEDNDDTQSTQESSQRTVSTGKHMCIDVQDRGQVDDADLGSLDGEDDEAGSQDQCSWGRPATSSANSTSSGTSSSDSNESDGTDSESDSSGVDNMERADIEGDNEFDINEPSDHYDKSNASEDEVRGGDSQSVSVITSKRRASNCSTKKEIDLNSSELGDKLTKHEYYDNTSSHGSSKASSKPPSVIDGAPGCKLKLKTPSSSAREVCNASSAASTSSSGTASSGGSGGIMKLKIQLKTQPDEKSKVYRIVD